MELFISSTSVAWYFFSFFNSISARPKASSRETIFCPNFFLSSIQSSIRFEIITALSLPFLISSLIELNSSTLILSSLFFSFNDSVRDSILLFWTYFSSSYLLLVWFSSSWRSERRDSLSSFSTVIDLRCCSNLLISSICDFISLPSSILPCWIIFFRKTISFANFLASFTYSFIEFDTDVVFLIWEFFKLSISSLICICIFLREVIASFLIVSSSSFSNNFSWWTCFVCWWCSLFCLRSNRSCSTCDSDSCLSAIAKSRHCCNILSWLVCDFLSWFSFSFKDSTSFTIPSYSMDPSSILVLIVVIYSFK